MALIQSEPEIRLDFSKHDLYDISQAISREFSPIIRGRAGDLLESNIAFSHRELLSISEEIGREFAPRIAENRANLVLLPIDARRLHAYWHLPDANANPVVFPVTENLTLRIYKQENIRGCQPDPVQAPTQCVDIAIDAAKKRQEILLPVNMLPANALSAAIGIIGKQRNFTTLVNSNVASMPNQPLSEADKEKTLLSAAAAGIIMSGLHDSSSVVKTQP